jgi:hypothetical protein
MHSPLLTKENLQTRIKPLYNDSVCRIRRQNTHTAGGVGLEPAAHKHVVPTYLPLDYPPPPSIEIMLNKDAIKERENLRPFRQRVTCFNYDVHYKLSPKSYEARVIGYTYTYGTYWIIDSFGKQRLAKNPKSIKVEDECDDESIIGESQSDIYNETLAFEQAVTPEPAMAPEQIIESGSRKKPQRKSAADYTALYGSRDSERTRHPSQKAKEAAGSIRTVGIDADHPTDEQVRASYNALE